MMLDNAEAYFFPFPSQCRHSPVPLQLPHVDIELPLLVSFANPLLPWAVKSDLSQTTLPLDLSISKSGPRPQVLLEASTTKTGTSVIYFTGVK